MRCNQCGKEIQDNSVFCPFCGVPQKVTADYDYIQSEIGANVEKIKNTGDTVEIKGHRTGDTAEIPNAAKRKEELMKTRNIYGNDTIYDDENDDYPEDYDEEYEDDYEDGYEDEYDEEYEDDYDRRYPASRGRGRHVDDDYFYNSFDDLDDYEKERGGNKGIVITTVIIVIICLLGIAGIIYFGLKPQDKNNADSQTVTTQAEQGGSETTDTAADSTDTAAETTTTAVSETAAKEMVFNYLVENDMMSSDYTTSDGGFIDLTVSGSAKIDDAVYYIIQKDYYDSSNNLTETTYYGVDTATGDLYKVEKSGATFEIV